jgi:hypothetical protein
MPHVFDHRPTAQEVFDAACTFFATTAGRSMIWLANGDGNNCKYRDRGRCCAVGYFIPDDLYSPEMDDHASYDDGTDVTELVRVFGDKLPDWFAEHKGLLKRLQGVHDAASCWTAMRHDEDGRPFWNHLALHDTLSDLAASLGLSTPKLSMIYQPDVPAGWASVEA